MCPAFVANQADYLLLNYKDTSDIPFACFHLAVLKSACMRCSNFQCILLFCFLLNSANIHPHSLSVWPGGWWLCQNKCRWLLHWYQTSKVWLNSSVPLLPRASNFISLCKHPTGHRSHPYSLPNIIFLGIPCSAKLMKLLAVTRLRSSNWNLLSPISLILFGPGTDNFRKVLSCSSQKNLQAFELAVTKSRRILRWDSPNSLCSVPCFFVLLLVNAQMDANTKPWVARNFWQLGR